MSAKMEADIQKLFAMNAQLAEMLMQERQMTMMGLNALTERLERLEGGEEKAAPNGQIKKAKVGR